MPEPNLASAPSVPNGRNRTELKLGICKPNPGLAGAPLQLQLTPLSSSGLCFATLNRGQSRDFVLAVLLLLLAFLKELAEVGSPISSPAADLLR